MTKKKLIALVMTLVMVAFVFTACTGGNKEANNAKKENATSTENKSNDAEKASTENAAVKAEGTEETKGGYISIATGGTGGTYYPLGGALSTILNNANLGYTATAQATGASVENLELIDKGDAEIAFVQNDVAYYAVNGKEHFEGNTLGNIRGLCTLYPEVVQIIASNKSGIEKVEDMKGKKVAVGDPGSGTEVNAKQILDLHGISFDDLGKCDHLSFSESADHIKSGQIDAAFVVAAIPSSAVTELATTYDVHLVPIADAKAKELIEKYPYYVNLKVSPTEYRNQKSDISVVAVQSMLAVSSEMADADAYNICKLLFDNLDVMKESHARGNDITLDTALDGMSIELHPGAQKFFDEAKK